METLYTTDLLKKCFRKISTRNKSYSFVQNKQLSMDFLNLYFDVFAKGQEMERKVNCWAQGDI
jgi:hypothetical protein